jgi:hypothetical protein
MLTLTEKEFNEIKNILDSYVVKLDKLNKLSEDYKNLKYQLDNTFCGLGILAEHDMLHAELNIGNVIIKDDILTCIYDNELHKFNMLKRKANNGEYAYITKATDCNPFNTKYIGRCFMVHKQPTERNLENVANYVEVDLEGLYTGWCLYDDQYVVLEELCKRSI